MRNSPALFSFRWVTESHHLFTGDHQNSDAGLRGFCGAESELAAVVTSRERLSSRAPLYSYCVCSSGVSQCCRLSCRLNCRYLTVVSVAFLLLLLLLAVLSRLRVSDSDCLSVFLSNLDITVMILHWIKNKDSVKRFYRHRDAEWHRGMYVFVCVCVCVCGVPM